MKKIERGERHAKSTEKRNILRRKEKKREPLFNANA